MDLEKRCERWVEEGELTKVIKEVEQVPLQLRTPKLNLYLATAYCGTSKGWKDREKFRKVFALCKPHQKVFGENFLWHFDMGYANSQLGMNHDALNYFITASLLDKNPEGMKSYIARCKDLLELPRFEVPFKERVEQAWKLFGEEQRSILRLLRGPVDIGALTLIRDKLAKVVTSVFNIVYLSVDYDGKVLRVVLSPGGSRTMLYALKYFIDHAPSTLSDKISFVLGTPPNQNAVLSIPNQGEISLSKIPTWVEKTEDGDHKVYLLAEPLQKLFPEDSNRQATFLYQLLFNAIGEIAAMKNISEAELVDTPRAGLPMPLSELGNYFKSEGIELDQDPTPLLTNTTEYELEPDESQKSILHMDIERGYSQCFELPRDYFDNEQENLDKLESAGATAGFILYFLDGFRGPDRDKEIEEFHNEFVKAIEEGAGKYAVKIIGRARGEEIGYIDFIAWDLAPIMAAAHDFLAKAKKANAAFHVFRRAGNVVGLYDGKIEGEPTEAEGSTTLQ